MIDSLVLLAEELDMIGKYGDADKVDLLIKISEEAHTDSKGVVWKKVGPVEFPKNHTKWISDSNIPLVIENGKLPDSSLQDKKPNTQTSSESKEHKEVKVETDLNKLQKGYKWLKENGWL